MPTPSEYRALAATYREAGEDANADVCEIMAQEAERLARYRSRDDPPPMDEEDTNEHDVLAQGSNEEPEHGTPMEGTTPRRHDHAGAATDHATRRDLHVSSTPGEQARDQQEPAVVMTKDGPQALLPTFTPPPATIDDHTQQLTLL